jgi:hypothetical protein
VVGAAAVALVQAPPPAQLPIPTCTPPSPVICWWCVGGVGGGRHGQGAAGGCTIELEGGALGQCHVVCAVGQLSRWGCVVWAWVWGAGSTCPALSGPCWCCDHCQWWVLVWALHGWKRWGQLGHVLCPRIGSSSCCGLFSMVCGGLWGQLWCPCCWVGVGVAIVVVG